MFCVLTLINNWNTNVEPRIGDASGLIYLSGGKKIEWLFFNFLMEFVAVS